MKLKFRNHPDLVTNWHTYQSIRDFDDGRPERVATHLIAHRSEIDGSVEGRDVFTNRTKRLININFVNPYLFLHWSHMSQPVHLAGADSEAMTAIKNDATGYNKNYTHASRDRLWLYIREGRNGTLVDSPAVIAQDRATARTTGERSYQVFYTATEIRYWEYYNDGPRKGQLKKLVLEQPPKKIDDQDCDCFRMFTQAEGADEKFEWFDLVAEKDQNALITTDEKEYQVVAQGVGGLTQIPFVIMGDGPNDSFAKDSWTLNKAWMNINSVLSHIIYNQGFQRSIFAGLDKDEIAKMTEWSVTVAAGDNVRIFTIPPGDPVAAQTECDKLKREIHRRAKFEYNQMADDTRAAQSAQSRERDLIVQKVIYDNTLDMAETIEERIWQLHALYEGEAPENIEVSIDREYGLSDKSAEEVELLSAFNQARELNVLDLQKEILKIRVAKLRFLPTETESEDEVRQRILKTIEAAKTASAQGQANLSGFGQQLFGSGVGVNQLAPRGIGNV